MRGETAAQWLYWTLFKAVVESFSSFTLPFPVIWFKINCHECFMTREQTDWKVCRTRSISPSICGVPYFSWIRATKLCRNRKTNLSLIIHSRSNDTSFVKPAPAEWESVTPFLGFPRTNTLITISVTLQLLSSHLLKYHFLNYLPKYNKKSPATSNVMWDRFPSKPLCIHTHIYRHSHTYTSRYFIKWDHTVHTNINLLFKRLHRCVINSLQMDIWVVCNFSLV